MPSTLKSLVSIAFIWGISLNQNIAQAQPTSLPTAESVWPAGKAGVDYNLSDEAGKRMAFGFEFMGKARVRVNFITRGLSTMARLRAFFCISMSRVN